MRMCKSLRCAAHFPADVSFCPYCGEAQQWAIPAPATSKSRVDVNKHSERDRVTVAAPARAQTILLSESTVPTVLPASGADAAAEEVGSMDRFASRFPILTRHSTAWIVTVAIAILLSTGLGRTFRLIVPDAGYVAVTCDGRIASDLSILIDLPTQLEQSTRAEVLVRLSQLLDAEHADVRRVSLFSTMSPRGDVGTPLVSACISQTPLGSLFNVHGLDSRLKAQFIDKVSVSLADERSKSSVVPLTQVISDLSVSQYLRSPKNSLVVFSDLVDKSASFSLLECNDTQDAIRLYRSIRAGAVERPAFRNASIDLHVIPDRGIRPTTAQCRKKFWNWYFSDMEGLGTKVSMNYLPGGMHRKDKL